MPEPKTVAELSAAVDIELEYAGEPLPSEVLFHAAVALGIEQSKARLLADFAVFDRICR